MNTPTTSHPTNGFAAATFDAAFASLLQSWNSHQALKDQKADISDLWSSRCALMDDRNLTANARNSHRR